MLPFKKIMPLWDNIVNSKWPFFLATLVGYPVLFHVNVLRSVEFFIVVYCCLFFILLSLFLVLFFAVLIVVRSPLLLFCFVCCFVFFFFVFSFPCWLFFISSYFCLTVSQGSVIDVP